MPIPREGGKHDVDRLEAIELRDGTHGGVLDQCRSSASSARSKAVNGVDLDVATGEIYGFLGPNGAGKSTTVRMLCTLLAPTSGRATVAGYDVATDPGAVRLRIGVALQEAALDPRQTGTELLRLQGLLYGLSKSKPSAGSGSSAS